MTKVSSERLSQILKPRGLRTWTVTLLLSHLFFCPRIPCWPWMRHIWNTMGRKRWELGIWTLIWSLLLIISGFCFVFSFNSSTQLQCPLPWICTILAEAIKMNSLIFQHQWNRDEESQIIIWSFYSALLSISISWRLQLED